MTTQTTTTFVKRMATLGMMLAAGTAAAFANINVTKSIDDLEMQAPTLKVQTPAQEVDGTGTVTFKFQFQIDNGCCMRVKAELMRQALPSTRLPIGIPPLPLPPTVVTSKTFEICGSLSDGTSLTTTLNSDQDNANFFVQFTNLDNWDKAHLTVTGLKVTFPIPLLILNTNPSGPLTLLQGQDQDRTFTVPADTTGVLNIGLSWTGTASMRLLVFKPGQDPDHDTPVKAVNSTAGQTKLTVPAITVTAADDGVWTLRYVNNSATNVAANSIVTAIKMTVNE